MIESLRRSRLRAQGVGNHTVDDVDTIQSASPSPRCARPIASGPHPRPDRPDPGDRANLTARHHAVDLRENVRPKGLEADLAPAPGLVDDRDKLFVVCK